jgi:hypothetical protein
MKAYIKKDSDRSDALWLRIERDDGSQTIEYPILADEVGLIMKACEKWLNSERRQCPKN